MQRKTIPLLFCVFILSSCQKESSLSSIEGPQTPLDEDNIQLIKKISVSGTDSTIIEYSYDAAGRLSGQRFKAINGNDRKTFIADESYKRDATGRIEAVNLTYDQPVEGHIYDLIETGVAYKNVNTAAVAYTKTIAKTGAYTGYDSTVYFYNSAGQVSKTAHYAYHSENGQTTAPQFGVYYNWTYDANGNLTSLQQFSDYTNSGNFSPAVMYQFEYDAKVNPLFTPDAALLESRWYATASPNNLVRQRNIYTGATPDENNITYNYNATGRPLTDTFVGNGMQLQTAYFYK